MKLSVVIPFYNEEGNIRFVIGEALEVLKTIPHDYEILAFDDGSRDQTPVILKDMSRDIRQLRVVTHPRNLGQPACLWEGFSQASGDVIIMIDGDGQNDFHDVPRMLALLDKADAVFGQRTRRDDPWFKLAASWVGFMVRRLVLGDTVRDTACGLKVMTKDATRHIVPVHSWHVYIPFMLTLGGVRVTTMAVNHRPRTKGQSKYALLKLYFIPYLIDLYAMWRLRIKSGRTGKTEGGVRP